MSTRDLARILCPILVVLIIISVYAVGKFFPPNGTLVCTLTSAPGDPHADYLYSVDFHLWKVDKVISNMTIISKNQDFLNQYATAADKKKKEYESLSFYEVDYKKKKTELTYTTTINYKEADYEKLESIEGQLKNNKKRLSLHAIKSLYEKIGAECKYS